MTIAADDQACFEWRPTAEQERKFAEFDAEHPEVWRMFADLTWRAIRAGKEQGSADMILHVIRWSTWLGEMGDSYRINNNHSSFFSRKWAVVHPEHASFFKRRKSKADKDFPGVRKEAA